MARSGAAPGFSPGSFTWYSVHPFGFLSYTTFTYHDLKLSARLIGPAGTLTISVTVANRGTREGTEVVQLYVRDEVASVTRPVRELRGFPRVTLKPGEARTVELRLAFSGSDMKPTLEPGTLRVFVGPNSAEGLQASFELGS